MGTKAEPRRYASPSTRTANALTITDNGIGMSATGAIDNLGTIAKSGTRDFVSKLEASTKGRCIPGRADRAVRRGLHSGFIVADKITVESRRAGTKDREGVR